MTSQVSDFTSASLEYISKHARARDIESDLGLQKLTLYNNKHGVSGLSREQRANASGHSSSGSSVCRKWRIEDAPVRFARRQSHATKGVRDIRLFTWAYIRRHEPIEVVDVVGNVASGGGESGHTGKGKRGKSWRESRSSTFGPLQRVELMDKLRGNPIYHFVGRGSDPIFAPPDDKAITDVVFSYFANPIHEIREYLLERLDSVMYDQESTGDTAEEAFRDLMADFAFVGCLKRYFEEGDTVRESSLHLAGRLRGGNCFLFRAIKENEVELLKLLLAEYSPEVTRDSKWLRLAEPCVPFGQYKNTAFHEAAYYGRYDCLQALLEYAQRFKIDVTRFRNEEDRRNKTGFTVLESAEKQANWRCYNLLAPYFSKEILDDETDENPREKLRQQIVTPRTECSFTYARTQRAVDAGAKEKGKVVVVFDFETLTVEEDLNVPSAAVSWNHFFEASAGFLRSLADGFASGRSSCSNNRGYKESCAASICDGKRSNCDPEYRVRIVFPADEYEEQMHLGTGIATMREKGGTKALVDSSMKSTGPVHQHDKTREMISAVGAGRLIRQFLVEKEQVAQCTLHCEFFCLRLCGPGTACIYEGACAWFDELSTRIFNAEFTMGRDISVRVSTFAFRSCFAARGETANLAWMRAVFEHVIDHYTKNPQKPVIKPKIYFRTLPAIAEFDDETIEYSCRLPENHVRDASALVQRMYHDILLDKKIFLDLNYNSAILGCFPGQDVTTLMFPEAYVRALDSALIPANMVRFMFGDILVRHHRTGKPVSVVSVSDSQTDDGQPDGQPHGSGECKNRGAHAVDDFKSSLTCCGAAEVLYNSFFDEKRLLTEHPEHVLDILDDRAIDYVELLLRAWFQHWPARNERGSVSSTDDSSNDQKGELWRRYAENLLVFSRCADQSFCDDDVRREILGVIAPYLQIAMDKAVSTFLRQFVVLDTALKRRHPEKHAECGNFFGWFELQVPLESLRGGLDITWAKLRSYRERYCGVS